MTDNAQPTPPHPVAPPEAPAPDSVPPAPDFTPLPAPPRDRRVLRAVLRWTAAVVVFAAVGTGTAYGIVSQERTDVPGLSTLSDGRWDYPKLTKPVLPAGAPLPFDQTNPAEIHYADLEQLLLPAPAGSTPDPALRGERGRVPFDRFTGQYVSDERDSLLEHLTESRARHVVARGWTMPDGTSARIFLLRFHTSAIAGDFFDTQMGGSPDTTLQPNGVEEMSSYDDAYDVKAKVTSTERYVYDEAAPRGPVHVRHAYITAGDTVAFVVFSRKGEVPRVPFHQTVVLQNQLLG
ncbi:hypothetical protein QFZ82_004405 [Streptomyces sp. V4I23]|uniref:hypothetical protein n=1 Tax=Streptomyces sp. V4I23 TaxID=3042282 RepID=UPI0027894AC4|nr:hypothetical protein [Streptomyces sp. V4I23]MDQ1009920.1 hypothetical protein [Streptomyces sp. V4I23]